MGYKSQIESEENIKNFVLNTEIKTHNDLLKLRDKLMSVLEIRPYNDETKEHERQIRWRRTASEVLKDGYVYQGKSFTDLVLTFLALCKAKNLETKFVKLKFDKYIHSVAEIKLQDGWYNFDVAKKDSIPQKGQIKEDDTRLWKKGMDSWDLGLVEFDSIKKIEK